MAESRCSHGRSGRYFYRRSVIGALRLGFTMYIFALLTILIGGAFCIGGYAYAPRDIPPARLGADLMILGGVLATVGLAVCCVVLITQGVAW